MQKTPIYHIFKNTRREIAARRTVWSSEGNQSVSSQDAPESLARLNNILTPAFIVLYSIVPHYNGSVTHTWRLDRRRSMANMSLTSFTVGARRIVWLPGWPNEDVPLNLSPFASRDWHRTCGSDRYLGKSRKNPFVDVLLEDSVIGWRRAWHIGHNRIQLC
jgi:hypothetical protein